MSWTDISNINQVKIGDEVSLVTRLNQRPETGEKFIIEAIMYDYLTLKTPNDSIATWTLSHRFFTLNLSFFVNDN
jgi:hypothetical protein